MVCIGFTSFHINGRCSICWELLLDLDKHSQRSREDGGEIKKIYLWEENPRELFQ